MHSMIFVSRFSAHLVTFTLGQISLPLASLQGQFPLILFWHSSWQWPWILHQWQPFPLQYELFLWCSSLAEVFLCFASLSCVSRATTAKILFVSAPSLCCIVAISYIWPIVREFGFYWATTCLIS